MEGTYLRAKSSGTHISSTVRFKVMDFLIIFSAPGLESLHDQRLLCNF